MIIIIRNWKQRLFNCLKTVVILTVLALTLAFCIRFLYTDRTVFNRIGEDRIPSGNPLRVEKVNKDMVDESVERFVIKLQDFYYEERE